KVVIEKRPQDLLAKVRPAITAETDCAERTAVTNLLAVVPRPHYQKNFVVVDIFWLDRRVNRRRAINIFLVPQAVHQHDRYLQRLCSEDFVHRLIAPKRVVAGMVENLFPESNLLQPMLAAKFAG